MAKTPKKAGEGEQRGEFPKDGEEYRAPGEENNDNEPGDGEDGSAEGGEEQEEEDPKVTIARLQGENAVLKAKQQERPASTPKKVEEPAIDWEKELFENTPEAIKKLKAEIRGEITTELRSEYRRDKGDSEFWAEFYAEHKDLIKDKDLVQLTLNSNMSTLGDLSVAEASVKLADLTRARILRYKGEERQKPGKKAVAEAGGGASGGRKKDDEPEKPEIMSLGDILRARKAKRAKAQTA